MIVVQMANISPKKELIDFFYKDSRVLWFSENYLNDEEDGKTLQVIFDVDNLLELKSVNKSIRQNFLCVCDSFKLIDSHRYKPFNRKIMLRMNGRCLPINNARGYPSRVICAANSYHDKDTDPKFGILILGVRHSDRLMHCHYGHLNEELIKDKKCTQGFIDNNGDFLTREEALLVALAANQLIEKNPPGYKLFSEDLY